VTFESFSRLERIEESAFYRSGLKSIVVPGSVTFVDGSALAGVSTDSVSLHKVLRISLNSISSSLFLISALLLLAFLSDFGLPG
jgi:hypothetical protein